MRTDFQTLKTTRKGNVGERIVKGILERAGWVVHSTDTSNPHTVDFYAERPGHRLAIDVKTYPRRIHYPDTGIDLADFEAYQSFEAAHNMPVHLAWVDEIEQAVYGRPLSHLARHATREGVKVYFGLEHMQLHRYLFPDELDSLRSISLVDMRQYAGIEYFFTWPRIQAMGRRRGG